MTKVRGVTGGGIAGNKVSQVHAPKREPRVDQIDPRRPSQIGLSANYVKQPLYQHSTASTPYGATPAECKPGGGRVVLPHGSQASHGPDRPMGSGRSLFK
jgi:hypothetical protein